MIMCRPAGWLTVRLVVIASFLWFNIIVWLRWAQPPVNYVARRFAQFGSYLVYLAPYACLCAPFGATITLDGRAYEMTPDIAVLLAGECQDFVEQAINTRAHKDSLKGSWCIATLLLFAAAPIVSQFVHEAIALVGKLLILALYGGTAVVFLVCVVLGVADMTEALGAVSNFRNGGLDFVCY